MDSKFSVAYFNFLDLVKGLHKYDLPALDPSEEKLLNHLGNVWHKGETLTVREGMALMPCVSIGTTHRRLKALRIKGFLDLTSDSSDQRVKYIVPTPLASKYFAVLEKCLRSAVKAA